MRDAFKTTHFLILLASGSAFAAATDSGCQRSYTTMRYEKATVVADEDDRFAAAVFAVLGCETKYISHEERLTFDRKLALLREGKIDYLAGVSRLPDRESYAWFALSHRSERVRLWVRKDDEKRLQQLTISSLRDNNYGLIGPMQGWYGEDYVEIREELRKKGRLVEFKQFSQAIALLIHHRGDIILGDEHWQDIADKSEEYQRQIVMLPTVVAEAPYYLMFSKATVRESDMLEINKAIAQQLTNNSAKKRNP